MFIIQSFGTFWHFGDYYQTLFNFSKILNLFWNTLFLITIVFFKVSLSMLTKLLISVLFSAYNMLSKIEYVVQPFNLRVHGTHCVKSVRIRSFSGPHFPAFGLNTGKYGVSLRIQSECGKIRTRKSPNMDTFPAMVFMTLVNIYGQRLFEKNVKGFQRVTLSAKISIKGVW